MFVGTWGNGMIPQNLTTHHTRSKEQQPCIIAGLLLPSMVALLSCALEARATTASRPSAPECSFLGGLLTSTIFVQMKGAWESFHELNFL